MYSLTCLLFRLYIVQEQFLMQIAPYQHLSYISEGSYTAHDQIFVPI